MCNKVQYTSKRQARMAVRKMGNTCRVYFHLDCGWYHVTKERSPRR